MSKKLQLLILYDLTDACLIINLKRDRPVWLTHSKEESPMIIVVFFFLLNQEQSKAVEFDIPIKLVCKDVTPEAFRNQKHKLVEIVFEVSTKIDIPEKDIDYIEIEIKNLGKHFAIQSFLPSLEMEDAVKDGEVVVTQMDRASIALGATGFGIRPPKGAGVIGKYEHVSGARYIQIAPKKMVKSSGFSDNKHAVWFKLRQSNNESLERPSQFAVLFVVPSGFQADLFSVSAKAFIKESSFFLFEKSVPRYSKIFVIGAYLDGSSEGEKACERLVELNKNLSKVVREPGNKTFYYTMIKWYLATSGLPWDAFETAYAYYYDNYSMATIELKKALQEVKEQQLLIAKLNGF